MMRLCHFLLGLALVWPAASQTLTRRNVATILGFENNSHAGVFPAGWLGNANGTIFADNQVVHSGRYSARIQRATTSTSDSFSTVDQSIPLDFGGKTIQWTGYVKTDNATGAVALWIREDDAAGNSIAFATTSQTGAAGTAGWGPLSISLPWTGEGQKLWFGVLLIGTGEAWVDDLQLTVDGVPVAQAPNRALTPLDTDHQFDAGSKIQLKTLSDTQVANLATLAKVWGFLKYHHPAVTGGQHHWDYDLFRVLPQVLASSDQASANATISAWIASLEPVTPCTACIVLNTTGLALKPNLDWIADTSLLGAGLSRALQDIYANRSPDPGFYISMLPGVGNPSFDHELSYASIVFPDAGYQLLALFRFWNMVRYFYPNREIMSDDPSDTNYWNQVLVDFIPRIALAPDAFTYEQEMIRFIAKINDTHANLWSSLGARPPIGSCYLPVDVRFVEERALVLRNTDLSAGPASGLLPGDIIDQVDGANVSDLVAQWAPLYADSNQAARLRDMGEYLPRGQCGPASVVVERGDQTLTLQPNRLPPSLVDFSQTYSHDLPGPPFQMLAPDVAYIKISTARSADAPSYIQAAANTRGLIIDIRDYPSDFPIYALGGLLVSQPTPFVRFTGGDVANPGAFRWTDPLQLVPASPHYTGKVVILVDEITQSSAEFHAMAFRTVPGSIVIGSTTAGADGNVSTVPLPGHLSSYISGLGVFYPDFRPTQRVGILPDIWLTPTINGIRAGRDELIEEAIRQIRAAGQTAPAQHKRLGR